MDLYLPTMGGIALILGLLWWFHRRFGTPKATAKTLLTEYDAFERQGLPEAERLYKLFATRSGWRNLPEAFLRELSLRLRDRTNIIDFVILAERYRLEIKQFPRLAVYDSKMAMEGVVMLLVSLSRDLRERKQSSEAETALSLALQVEPDNHLAMLALAMYHYAAGQYTEAIPLFERGIPLCEQFLERSRRLEHMFSEAGLPSLPPEHFGTREELAEGMVAYKQMYEDCLKRCGVQAQ